MVKPDGFKKINDRFGHEAGDRVLKAIVGALKAAAGSKGITTRFRGDEFAVIFPAAGTEGARRMAQDIVEAMRAVQIGKIVDGDVDSVTLSTGIAFYSRDGKTNMELIQSAFELMFMAREAGGDRVLCSGDAVEVR
jgi:diguanylate cyclase (GGDEF)-like protein